MYNRYNNMNQNNYGWGNAVSDILGAVMQRNAERGEQKKQANMILDVANFGEDLNNLDFGGQTTFQDLGSRANPNSNYTNKTASTQAMQGLLPTSFNQTVPTSDALGQGLLGQPLNPQPAQANNFEFTNQLDKYSKENNPAMVTTSAPKTLQEQERMIKSQIPKVIKQYIDKGYKIDQILPLIKQTADDKIAELKSSNQDKVINELYQGFISKEADANPNLKAMYAARLKQAGYDVTTPYKEFAPEYKAERFDNGNTNDAYSFNPKTGKYELQVSMAKGVTPDAQLRADTSVITAGMRQRSGSDGGSRSTGGGGNYGDGGRKTGTTKQLDPIKAGQYSTRYQEILADIWDTKTAKDRSALVNQYTDELNALGQALDKDVKNDIDYIINTNPRGQ